MDTDGERSNCTHELKCSHRKDREDKNHPADSCRCPARLEQYGTAQANDTQRPASGKKQDSGEWINMYNNPKQKQRSRIHHLQNLELPLGNPVIISGDFNIHHIRWVKGAPNNDVSTNKFVKWVDETGLTLLNRKGEITYTPHGRWASSSVIDLTFVNVNAITLDATKDWAINPDIGYGSNHKGIQWIIDYGTHPIPEDSKTRYNFKATDVEEWTGAFGEAIKARKNKLDKLLDNKAPLSHTDLKKL